MKKNFYFLLFSIAMLLFACTNDQESDLLPSKEAKGTVDMLNFATEEEFFNAVESPEATLKTISTHSDFKSLYNEYEEAWEIEEEYYASEEKYNEFKMLFPHLYFPEYKDDYSFFLPVSNESVAKLLNLEGNVRIAGEVVNYIDIKTPQDLLKLGQLAPDDIDNRIMTRNGGYLNDIPNQYGSDGDRKFWVTTVAGGLNGRPYTTIEVYFRRKGAGGHWKNYKSRVTVIGRLQYATGEAMIFPVTSEKYGKAPLKFEFLSSAAPNVNPFPCRGNNIKISYQGIHEDYYMNVDISPKQ